VGTRMHLADILRDPKNLSSMARLFGDEGMDVGLQLVAKMALADYSHKSFTIHQAIESERKFDFIFKTVGGWKQFDAVLTFHAKNGPKGHTLTLINPTKRDQWMALQALSAGTLVNVYLFGNSGKRSLAQEQLALDRYKTVFDLVQSRVDLANEPAPTVQLNPGTSASKPTTKPIHKAAPRPSVNHFPRVNSFSMGAAAGGKPVMSFQVVINKMDTFVHAGNAHLIVTHVTDYKGRIMMFVLRGEKKAVQIDADSIWGAEIRNGETVLYEFYGPQPDEAFVKELAKKTNKYTQMDKIANE
ncbi:MAG: hypothetical protein ACXVBW_11065, partial [Bdellovibrionota bacterium]